MRLRIPVPATNLSAAVEGNSLGEIAMNEAFWLVASHAIGLRPNVVTAAVARAVALKQNPAGDWPALGERPPSNHSPFTFTALALRSLQLYGHPRQKDDIDRRIARARAWLQSHVARDTEGRSYQLLGLAWADVPRDIIRRFGRFPHRNPILGRAMTAAEQEYLDAGGFAG